ncbi:MAG: type II toxin-antitoxin system HicA family toxin [Chloroflexi bacterium]|nr:type II toxin-antitoxin system HicA family toxin [Chloroflexota bacterium]
MPEVGWRLRLVVLVPCIFRFLHRAALFVSLGAEVTEGRGSRVRVALNDVRAVFHRPHPQKETDKGAVKSARRFLMKVKKITQ